MELEAIFSEIESVRFAAFANVASGFKIFRMILEDSNDLSRLVQALKEQPDHVSDVVARIDSLASDRGDPVYRHPHDTTQAAYLWTVAQIDVSQANQAADRLNESEGLFWAKRMADAITAEVEAEG